MVKGLKFTETIWGGRTQKGVGGEIARHKEGAYVAELRKGEQNIKSFKVAQKK